MYGEVEEGKDQLFEGDKDEDFSEAELTTEEKDRDEKVIFQTSPLASEATDSIGLMNLESFCELLTHKWWCDTHASDLFLGFSRVALGFLSIFPGYGGLECDIGSIGDIFASKRSISSLEMIKAMFLIKINKIFRTIYSTKITKLSKNEWENFISDRDYILTEVDEKNRWREGGQGSTIRKRFR